MENDFVFVNVDLPDGSSREINISKIEASNHGLFVLIGQTDEMIFFQAIPEHGMVDFHPGGMEAAFERLTGIKATHGWRKGAKIFYRRK